MSSTGQMVVSLWVKAEPFTFGALPVAPHPRLNVHNIKKIISYAKTKGKAGFPHLSYSVWKHIACNKLQLPEELAWMYFVTYDTVREGVTALERVEWDKRMAKCASQQEIDALKTQISVPTLEFVLFLYVQHLHKISLRASLVSGSDEWPLRARSPDLESGRSTPTGTKSLNEHGHLTFVLNNLNEIMELLIEPDSYTAGGGSNDASLSMDAVQALGFIIGSSVDRNKIVKPIHEIAVLQQSQQKCGYSKISRSFSFRSLQSWLRSYLSQNPFGISSCISSGRRLSWPLAGEEKEARESSSKRGRIATNALYVPRDIIKGNKIIIMSQVCKQTVARSSGTLEFSSVKIHRCHFSFIYLLSPLRSVTIEKCRHTTVVLGPVETTVHLNNCDQVTVIAPARRLTISSSSMCMLHLLTPTRPLILSGNESLILAPYHTFYGKLEEHMVKAGVSAVPNLWDKPLCIDGEGKIAESPDHQEGSPVWELLTQKDFYLFTIPLEVEGTTTSVPGGISPQYQRALVQRERQIEAWQRMVKDAGLTKEQRKYFQGIVEQRFQKWLFDTGQDRQLDNLEWLSDTGNKRQLDGLVTSANKAK